MPRALLTVAASVFLLPGVALAQNSLAKQARETMKKARAFFRSIATYGGYCGSYSLDLKRRYGEARYERAGRTEIWVQPPGTPTVGETFLRAGRATGGREYLAAAAEVGRALAWGQRRAGGWDHRADLAHVRPDAKRPVRVRGRCTLDDNITQGALSFLIDLDQVIDAPWLTESVKLGLRFVRTAQFKNGAWPQWYPLRGGYHDYYTFNDNAINDCIRVLLKAHRVYGRAEDLAAARRGGDFIIRSQLPAPQSGWAQQYARDLKPAWARAFEPPGVCTAVTARNLRTLVDLHLYTRDARYLRPIPAAIRWLERSKLGEGRWARLYELGTNKPIYGDRDRKVHYTLAEISAERRSGYSWQSSYGIPGAVRYYQTVKQLGAERYLAGRAKPITAAQQRARARALEPEVRKIIAALDAKGRWAERIDRKGRPLKELAIHTQTFVRNMNTLCEYLERIKAGS